MSSSDERNNCRSRIVATQNRVIKQIVAVVSDGANTVSYSGVDDGRTSEQSHFSNNPRVKLPFLVVPGLDIRDHHFTQAVRVVTHIQTT